jgi:hopanoid biosynthesis associated radical SAM protein HpnH
LRFPLNMTTDIVKHQLTQALRGRKRYPSVLMLEPLYTCNLACVGCATERHTGKLKDRLPVETCLRAADDCEAPLVSICGGEPTLYPELPQLVAELLGRKRHIYLCTNGLLLEENVFGTIAPAPGLTLNVHLDGMRATHDAVCAREGVFDRAIEMIREGKRRGYRVMANTTIFKQTEIAEVEELCELLTSMHIDGILLSPGYHYESVKTDIFLTREEIRAKFHRVLEFAGRYPIHSTPMFLEFAAGLREYSCSPWSTVTFTPHGWKGPCYLIGERLTQDWKEFWNGTDWAYWESRQDHRCQNCAMHSGFEASAVREVRRSPRDLLRLAVWNLQG